MIASLAFLHNTTYYGFISALGVEANLYIRPPRKFPISIFLYGTAAFPIFMDVLKMNIHIRKFHEAALWRLIAVFVANHFR